MQHCTIRLADASHPQCCPSCGQHHHLASRGPRLFLEAHADPLCRGCGKKLAPAMAALLDLAHTAKANALVTGDRDLLVLAGQTSFSIVSPEEYQEELQGQVSDQ